MSEVADWWGSDVRFAQALLRACGLYTGALDGIDGPRTRDAFASYRQQSQDIADREGTVEPVSASRILRLQLKAQIAARRVMRVAANVLPEGTTVRISAGVRTPQEQAELYAKGRTKPGPRVTNAKPGESWHNYGRAFDLAVLQGNAYVTAAEPYRNIGHEVGRAVALPPPDHLVWGGEFRSIKDYPHYELAWSGTAAQYGELFFAPSLSPLLLV